MNIVVLLRNRLDPAGFTVNRKAQRVFVNRKEYRLNPADLNALEAALRLGEAGHPVTVVACGGPPAEDAARHGLALGAERALLVEAPALQEADAAVLAAVLRRAVEYLGDADLVMLGAEVDDADLAQVGPRLAEALGRPFVEAAHEVRLDAAGDEMEAVVARGDGYRRVACPLPVVASVARDANRPRYAPAARVMWAFGHEADLERVTVEALGLAADDLAPRVERRGQAFPPERELGRVFEGSLDEAAAAVARALDPTR